MATNAQKTVDWAEDGEPDLATAIPAPQVSKNKDEKAADRDQCCTTSRSQHCC
jgi:hypothetical protein